MNAETLAFRESVFDCIIMTEVLEHIQNDGKILDEAYRVLKTRGQLIMTVPNRFSLFETHGIRFRSRIYGTKGLGIPLIPYPPEGIRKHIANARVYTLDSLKRTLPTGFQIESRGYILQGWTSLSSSIQNFRTVQKKSGQ